ncbi:hypothetical protein WJX73_003326 [Symbiochloris irregularis]|uniref:Endonuclease/exonuclease/phosphatase domain-containing protein n=1 Tax=Symbiochloris irregularis TaxID=706552 RepID=A0AAW1NWQ8_9CHLO
MPVAVETSLTPGAIFQRDFRTRGQQTVDGRPLRILQWNIERGYQLQRIISELKAADADIIALQEIDIGNERSDKYDTGVEIATQLCLNYAFLCEFEELHSPQRSADAQGGGVHGNAILSKFDISNVRAIEHR